MDKNLKMPLSILLGGYIFSLGFYFIWCFYFFYERMYKDDYLLVIAAVVFAITAVYLIPFILILYIESLQKVWISFSLVSLITLLIFLLIPITNYKIYYRFNDDQSNLTQDMTVKTGGDIEPEINIPVDNKKEIERPVENDKEKLPTENKGKEEIHTEVQSGIAMDDAERKLISELQAKLESERIKNAELKKQLNELNGKTKSSKEKRKTKKDEAVPANSNKNFAKKNVDSKVKKTRTDTKNQRIIFKVQIISSGTRLRMNSPRFKSQKNISEYKDNGLYKYTVGNQLDLKSASVLQSEFRKKGFAGAFVVAFKNGKRIPMKEAMDLYKIQGNI